MRTAAVAGRGGCIFHSTTHSWHAASLSGARAVAEACGRMCASNCTTASAFAVAGKMGDVAVSCVDGRRVSAVCVSQLAVDGGASTAAAAAESGHASSSASEVARASGTRAGRISSINSSGSSTARSDGRLLSDAAADAARICGARTRGVNAEDDDGRLIPPGVACCDGGSPALLLPSPPAVVAALVLAERSESAATAAAAGAPTIRAGCCCCCCCSSFCRGVAGCDRCATVSPSLNRLRSRGVTTSDAATAPPPTPACSERGSESARTRSGTGSVRTSDGCSPPAVDSPAPAAAAPVSAARADLSFVKKRVQSPRTPCEGRERLMLIFFRRARSSASSKS
eukprot:Rhum_TRINITY_DN14511_c28_g1::Rhum_TRINITY_DN14511_c28_g1_i1::g.93886::m.93886